MKLTTLLTRRRVVRTLCAIVLAYPLLGAEGCPGLTDTKDDSSSYDGTYTLSTVDGRSLPTDIIYVDSRNRLVLTAGQWTVSGGGTRLDTQMYTTSIVNGVSTREARFNPERHYATITISGSTASGTLDSGSRVSATFGSGYVVTSQNGHTLRFTK